MRIRVGVCAALTLAVVLVYAPVVTHDFINLDDGRYVYANPPVVAGLSAPGVAWAFTTTHESNWHPLTWLSLMLDVELFGLDAGALHATNLVLHAVNTLLLFLLLDVLTGAPGRSALVAALFALHPLHVESVAWIAERKDVLSTLFWLLATLAYVGWVRRRSRALLAAAVLAMALGLMAKPMLVTLPFALLLLDVWPLGRISIDTVPRARALGPLLLEKLPLFGLSAASIAITLAVQPTQTLAGLPLVYRLQGAVMTYGIYLRRMLWPSDLSIFYPYRIDWAPVEIAGVLLLLLALTAAAWVVRRHAAYVPTGWLFFVGTLVPTIGLVHVGGQALADRYTYVPSIGLFWAVVWGGFALTARGKAWRAASIGVAAVALLGLASETRAYVKHWTDSEALFGYLAERSPGNFVVHERLGAALLERGELEGAISHLESSLVLRPNRVLPIRDLGRARARSGDAAGARTAFRLALDIDPDDVSSRWALAWLLATSIDPEVWDGDAAVLHMEALCAQTGCRAFAELDGLAAAYAAAERFDEAVATAARAQAVAEATGATDWATRLASHGARYARGESLRGGTSR